MIVKQSVPSSTTPSHLTPTQPMQPQIDLPPLDYQSNLPIHDAFILATEKELIRDTVNNCTMIKPSLREGFVQATLANAVQDCSKKTRSDPAGLTNKEIEGYDLRPLIWSNTSESKWKQKKIKSLIGDTTRPLKFLFKKDEETGEWMVFEHDALLDVVLGVLWTNNPMDRLVLDFTTPFLLPSLLSMVSSQGHAIMTTIIHQLRELARTFGITIMVINGTSAAAPFNQSSASASTIRKPVWPGAFVYILTDCTLWSSKTQDISDPKCLFKGYEIKDLVHLPNSP
ncbi:uncharacterized protein EDB93DRAFT_1270149 [Suillus bovinus]|uniref:uncharacterized protein n=1 Tax=Suillus bovinus TaxID=48563 RepID=UPI001B87C199|nr:uncharacterized protein EDB93DRAFT_1270149 [Suillus bovinus]KAG2127604.1 hypothetical protein EDB93DRAFT_1270149 [Suillus bovinus]